MDFPRKWSFIIFVLLEISSVIYGVRSEESVAEKQYLACNPSNETVSCPENSKCIDNGTSSSFCVCPSNSTVNADFSKNQKPYCVSAAVSEKKNVTTTTSTTTSTTTESSPLIQEVSSTKSEPSDVKVTPAAIPHFHIFSGIFLPIFIVLGFIAGVFLIKKYELLDRAHGFIRNRTSNQNQYNGLMEADFDDDACLI